MWALHKENSNLKKKAATPDSEGRQRQGNQSNAEFPAFGPQQYWVRGVYCWSYLFGIEKRHNSGNFRNKNTHHQDSAT